MMGEAVEQCGGHLGVTEDGWPFAEGEIGGDDDRGALIEPADQMEQQLAACVGKRQVSEFVEYSEVQACVVVGDAALLAIAMFGVEPVDEVDDIEEAAASSVADQCTGDADRQMRFAGSSAADEDGVALVGEEGSAGQLADQSLVTGVPSKSKSSMSLVSGSLATVSWYLIDRACFSAISAESRSPTMRGGSCWRLMPVAMTSS